MSGSLLLILLLPLELLRPVQEPQTLVLYQDHVPQARIEIRVEQPDAAEADPGVFRLLLHPVDGAAAELLEGTREILVERSRRRGSIYTVYAGNDPPELVDMSAVAAQIPHDILRRIGRPGESIGFMLGAADGDPAADRVDNDGADRDDPGADEPDRDAADRDAADRDAASGSAAANALAAGNGDADHHGQGNLQQQDVQIDFLPGSTLIRLPSMGVMLLLQH
ncbi:hypothetical protein [Spirochaeta africana]|uniref:Uncharacterized protein n=1 Tax=Spirochaeta africana (strain ATCC 700263 / DSM 8902 / Z-7692) TaxID=889378 RepID=H9ULR2_SPIAZ|nr:hypothetical protein [Spirochaeta africana]AFG38455.1 hypothetical protein Spiaf_2424 [Spirochaeta africana DSM 8902]